MRAKCEGMENDRDDVGIDWRGCSCMVCIDHNDHAQSEIRGLLHSLSRMQMRALHAAGIRARTSIVGDGKRSGCGDDSDAGILRHHVNAGRL